MAPPCNLLCRAARARPGGRRGALRRVFPFALAVLAACANLDVLTDTEIDKVGLQLYEAVVAEHPVVSSGADFEMVRRVASRIVQATGEDLPWQVTLLRADDLPNAISLPGGRIAVYSGLLPIIGNESGLAIVIGHEVAHAVLRHGAKRMVECTSLHAGLVACQEGLDVREMGPEARQGLMAAFGIGTGVGRLLPFSADDEDEADELGLRYAIRAGYDPWEAPKLWERMAKRIVGDSRGWTNSHPASGARGATLRALIPQLIAEEKRGGK